MLHLLDNLNKKIVENSDESQGTSGIVDIKELIMKSCGNIFNEYFCSRPRSEYSDQTFTDYIENFDKIFWEVNNGRACDFLPWLMPILKVDGSLKKMEEYTSGVRAFVEDEIIEPKEHQRIERRVSMDGTKNNGDFLDSLMTYINEDLDEEQDVGEKQTGDKRRDSDVKIDRSIALYALEDILGGHCAVGNITLRIINDLAENNKNKEEDNYSAQEIIQRELDVNVGSGKIVSLDSKKDLHWMTAAMHETIRLTCSPIVPHQASKDSTINGKLNKAFTLNKNWSYENLYIILRLYNQTNIIISINQPYFLT
jgi:cytochrome P450 family 307 subfamily A